MLATFLVMRGSMALRPNADFTLAGYNIHHLFTGLLILTACGIPLVVGYGRGRVGDLLTAGFGIGLSLALDEWGLSHRDGRIQRVLFGAGVILGRRRRGRGRAAVHGTVDLAGRTRPR